MPGDFWTFEEEKYLRENCNKSCNIIAKHLNRTTKAVQHKFNQLGLEKPRAKVGDVVKGWEILEIFLEPVGGRNMNFAKIKSTDPKYNIEKKVRLTCLTNEQLAAPGRKRPDLSEKNRTHGQSKTRLHGIWMGMKSRCFNKNHVSYEKYGGKGIVVCDEWKDDFVKFKEWSEANGYSQELTLDRKENNKGYCPDNCRWANSGLQARNKINSICGNIILTAFGESKTISEWLIDDRCKIHSITGLLHRIKQGKLSPEEIVSSPSQRQHKLSIKNWLKEKYPQIYKQYKEYGA